MSLSEYAVMFVLVAIMGAGLGALAAGIFWIGIYVGISYLHPRARARFHALSVARWVISAPA